MQFFRKKDIEEIIDSLDFDKNILKNKNIIITGGFGFIGKYILQVLIGLRNQYNIDLYL